jgi:uncharacterized membrane protein YphA (DoxX/SURF4 family)
VVGSGWPAERGPGEFDTFVAYTGTLNWFLPHAMIPPLAIIATCAEIVLGLLLLAGWQMRIAALCSALLLMASGLTMTLALGITPRVRAHPISQLRPPRTPRRPD